MENALHEHGLSVLLSPPDSITQSSSLGRIARPITDSIPRSLHCNLDTIPVVDIGEPARQSRSPNVLTRRVQLYRRRVDRHPAALHAAERGAQRDDDGAALVRFEHGELDFTLAFGVVKLGDGRVRGQEAECAGAVGKSGQDALVGASGAGKPAVGSRIEAAFVRWDGQRGALPSG